VVIESEVLLWAALTSLLVADVVFWVLSVGGAASEETSFRLVALAVGLMLPLLAVAIQVVDQYFVEVSTQFAWGTAAGLWFLGLWVYGVVFGGRVARADG
jgi:ABC-type long-subunit fatty acid transport system fused permease/ATPase subunit